MDLKQQKCEEKPVLLYTPCQNVKAFNFSQSSMLNITFNKEIMFIITVIMKYDFPWLEMH